MTNTGAWDLLPHIIVTAGSAVGESFYKVKANTYEAHTNPPGPEVAELVLEVILALFLNSYTF